MAPRSWLASTTEPGINLTKRHRFSPLRSHHVISSGCDPTQSSTGMSDIARTCTASASEPQRFGFGDCPHSVKTNSIVPGQTASACAQVLAGTDLRSQPPQADELEVSLIGPGYGECIVIHFGGGTWVIVDSCINVLTRTPVALEYLGLIDVDIASAVRLVVATHWHDDHIRGLSQVVRAAAKSRFVISAALRAQEFATLTALMEPRMMQASSGVRELRMIYEYLAQAGAPPQFATADRRLWSPAGRPLRSVWSLAPSDRAIQLALDDIASILSDRELPNRRVPALRPNHSSVVLWCEAAGPIALLGGGLQETADERAGWRAIVASDARPPGQAEVFKVPHHGSVTAHCQAVWDEMLQRRTTIAAVTPFMRGNKQLPTAADGRRLLDRAAGVYITQTDR